MSFAVERTARPEGLCVAVAGEVDADTAPRMKAELLDAVRHHRLVTVDLSAVTFMDSQGLAALIRARKEAESCGGTLHLDAVPARILKLLQLTGLHTVFTVVAPGMELTHPPQPPADGR